MENLKLNVKLSAYTKGAIPNKLSDLENDMNFVQDENYIHTDNNYTNEDKERLDSYNKETVLNGAVRYDVNQILSKEEQERVKAALNIPEDISILGEKVEELEEFKGIQEQTNEENLLKFENTGLAIEDVIQDISSLSIQVEDLANDIGTLDSDKLNKQQGIENKDKALIVGADGILVPTDLPEVSKFKSNTITKINDEYTVVGIEQSNRVVITGDKINQSFNDIDTLQNTTMLQGNRLSITESKISQIEDEVEDHQERIVDLEAKAGAGGYLRPHNFSTETPSDELLTNYALSEIESISEPEEIWNGTKIINTFNNTNNVFILNNTPNTIPKIFEWVPMGSTSIGIATNNTLGIVKSSEEEYGISVDVKGTMIVNSLEEKIEEIHTELEDRYTIEEADNKFVEQVSGKELSENDLTNSLKENYDNAYTHSLEEGNAHNTKFSELNEIPTSLSGFGITDSYTKTEIESELQDAVDTIADMLGVL